MVSAGGFLQILEPEFELVDAGAALRGGPEPLSPQPGDLELQPFDLDAEGQLAAAPPSRPQPCLALRQDHRMGGGEVGAAATQARSAPAEKSIFLKPL